MTTQSRILAYFLVGSLSACQPGASDRVEGDAAGGRAEAEAVAGGGAASGTDARAEAGAETAAEARADAAAAARARGAMDERLTAIDTAVQRLPGLIASIRRDTRRYLNDDHVAAARRNGVGPVRDSAQVAALVRSGELVELPDSTRWWVLRELDRSMPYVTPDTRTALEEIGRRFHARLDERGLPPFRLDVTSVLRTGRQQAALRRRNANAAETVSSHQFGTTFDVAYLSFAAPLSLDHASLTPDSAGELPRSLRGEVTTRLDTLGTRRAPHLEGELGAVLQEVQRDGVVLMLRERSQPVFHVTVAGGAG